MSQHFLPPLPDNENERLLSILNYEILDTENEEQLDELTHLAASIFKVPIALITIIDQNRQWFKSNYGLNVKQTERSISFCQYTIMSEDIFEVENALADDRFVDNPLVTKDPHIRFYCGTPLINEEGFKMGSLALIDRVPRKLDANQRKVFKLLAQQIVNNFELKMKKRQLEKEKSLLEDKVAERTKELEQKISQLKKRDEKLLSLNNELNSLIYKASHDLMGPIKTMQGIVHLALNELPQEQENDLKYYKLLSQTAQKLDHTLISLLKVASIQKTSHQSVICWESFFNAISENVKARLPGKKLDVRIRVKVRRKFISDPELLRLIFEELMVNSVLYNVNEHVLITIGVSQTANKVKITVEDNGVGLLESQGENIYKMFFKTPSSKGSGLGLYIVSNIIDKLSGEISFASKLNEGTTFTILLPFVKTR
jgi:signal transduction histidine kinase